VSASLALSRSNVLSRGQGSHPDSWPGRLFDKERYGEPHGAQRVAATDGQYASLEIEFQGKDLDRGTMLSDYWAVTKSCDDPDCVMNYPPCTLDWDVPYTRWQTYGSEPGCTQSFEIDHGDCDNKEAPDYSEEPYCMLSCRTGGTSFSAVFRFYYCCMDPEGDCDCVSIVPWGRATAYNAGGFPIYSQLMITHGCNYTSCAFGDDGPGPLVGVPDRWVFEVLPFGTCPDIGLLGAAVSYQCCDCPAGGPG